MNSREAGQGRSANDNYMPFVRPCLLIEGEATDVGLLGITIKNVYAVVTFILPVYGGVGCGRGQEI